jgi:hypothetical protein
MARDSIAVRLRLPHNCNNAFSALAIGAGLNGTYECSQPSHRRLQLQRLLLWSATRHEVGNTAEDLMLGTGTL